MKDKTFNQWRWNDPKDLSIAQLKELRRFYKRLIKFNNNLVKSFSKDERDEWYADPSCGHEQDKLEKVKKELTTRR